MGSRDSQSSADWNGLRETILEVSPKAKAKAEAEAVSKSVSIPPLIYMLMDAHGSPCSLAHLWVYLSSFIVPPPHHTFIMALYIYTIGGRGIVPPAMLQSPGHLSVAFS